MWNCGVCMNVAGPYFLYTYKCAVQRNNFMSAVHYDLYVIHCVYETCERIALYMNINLIYTGRRAQMRLYLMCEFYACSSVKKLFFIHAYILL